VAHRYSASNVRSDRGRDGIRPHWRFAKCKQRSAKVSNGQGVANDNGTWELLDQHAWKWDVSTPLIIEPGESNQLHYELTLSADIGPLEIYSYFRNPTITDRDVGWRYTSIYHPGHVREGAPTTSR
jgi:hypothetical protein